MNDSDENTTGVPGEVTPAPGLAAILTAVNEISFIATDPAGTITFFGPGAERLLGYKAEDVVGVSSPVRFHLPFELSARQAELSRSGLACATPFEALVAPARRGDHEEPEFTYVARDGSHKSVALCVAEAPNVGYLFAAKDITARRASERLRRELLSAAAGELRSPLTSIRGAHDLGLSLGPDDLGGKARALFELADRNGERLTRLLSDMLEIERTDVDVPAAELSTLDMGALASEAVSRALGLAETRSVQLSFERATGSMEVRGESNRLTRVVNELLWSAIFARLSRRLASRDGDRARGATRRGAGDGNRLSAQPGRREEARRTPELSGGTRRRKRVSRRAPRGAAVREDGFENRPRRPGGSNRRRPGRLGGPDVSP